MGVGIIDSIDRLLARARDLETRMEMIQAGTSNTVSEDEIRALRDEYVDWYAECSNLLRDDLKAKFQQEYDGKWHSPKIKQFLAEPTRPGVLSSTIDAESSSSQPFSYWQYPYARTFLTPFMEQQALLRQARQQVSTVSTAAKPDTVFVVYGRNIEARNTIVSLLRAAGLKPLEFEQARQLTGQASPYIGTILDAAFAHAQATLAIFTDDERVKLRTNLAHPNDPKGFELQPRPNVIFEAGMALGLHPDRTVIVEVGRIRQISDLVGRHVVRWDNSIESRKRLLQRLQDAGCNVDLSGEDWMAVKS